MRMYVCMCLRVCKKERDNMSEGISVCACGCVCVRERGKKRQKERGESECDRRER